MNIKNIKNRIVEIKVEVDDLVPSPNLGIKLKLSNLHNEFIDIYKNLVDLIKDKFYIKELSIKEFKYKNINYIHRMDYNYGHKDFYFKQIKFIHNDVNFVNKINNSDIIIFDIITFLTIPKKISENSGHQALSDALSYLRKSFNNVHLLIDIIKNKCKIIEDDNIIIDNLIDEFIPKDIQESIKLMLSSDDEEIFELGLDTLWKYDYIKNKDIILLLLSNINIVYSNEIEKQLDCNPLFQKWILYFPILKKIF